MSGKTKIINLFGGPGSGKSTTAAELFAVMKKRGHSVELVTEYAKELVYGRSPLLGNQKHIFDEQNRRQKLLLGNVNYAITDSPIFLSTIYAGNDTTGNLAPDFVTSAVETFNSYNNINFYLNRLHPYRKDGRLQNEEGANNLGEALLLELKKHSIQYTLLNVDDGLIQNILKELES